MAPMAAWGVEAFGLDKVLSRGGQSEVYRNRLAEAGKSLQRGTALPAKNCALGQVMRQFTSPAPLDNPDALKCVVINWHLCLHKDGAWEKWSRKLWAEHQEYLTGTPKHREFQVPQLEAAGTVQCSQKWATTRVALGQWGILLALPRRA